METVSVSMANLITQVYEIDTGIIHNIAVRHPTKLNQLQAFSAGPGLMEGADKKLAALVGRVSNLRPKSHELRVLGAGSYDGRVEGLSADLYPNFVRFVIQDIFDQDCVEWDPLPELIYRLTRPYWSGVTPPLEEIDFLDVFLEPGKIIRQPKASSGAGGRQHTVRLFRPITLHATTDLYSKLLGSGVFMPLTDQQLQSTDGGATQGEATLGKVTYRLANNLGVVGVTDPFKL